VFPCSGCLLCCLPRCLLSPALGTLSCWLGRFLFAAPASVLQEDMAMPHICSCSLLAVLGRVVLVLGRNLRTQRGPQQAEVRGVKGEAAELDSTPAGQTGARGFARREEEGEGRGESRGAKSAGVSAGTRPRGGESGMRGPRQASQGAFLCSPGQEAQGCGRPSAGSGGRRSPQSESGSESESSSEREVAGQRRGFTALDLNGTGEGHGQEM